MHWVMTGLFFFFFKSPDKQVLSADEHRHLAVDILLSYREADMSHFFYELTIMAFPPPPPFSPPIFLPPSSSLLLPPSSCARRDDAQKSSWFGPYIPFRPSLPALRCAATTTAASARIPWVGGTFALAGLSLDVVAATLPPFSRSEGDAHNLETFLDHQVTLSLHRYHARSISSSSSHFSLPFFPISAGTRKRVGSQFGGLFYPFL